MADVSLVKRVLGSKWGKALLGCGAALLVGNEIRGVIMAAPVLYALWLSGGPLMAYWLAFCSLAGIALSVVVPLWVARKMVNRAGQ